jgi:predicted phosphate transport protein (TIGR00153 family)
MRFSLIPREMRFFDMFDEVAAQLNAAARSFVEMLKQFDRLEERGKELKRQEEACDALVGKIILALDVSFITPFDREDIHTLTTRMDDVMDKLEETAHRFTVYRIESPTPTAQELARIILDSCSHIEKALHLCRDMKKSAEIHPHLRELGRLENEADRLYREADAALLAGGDGNILGLIKWRELYAWLEQTVDACKEVGNIISEIVIKGS